MSHGKMTKRGTSYFIEKWNPNAKRFIRICSLCGRKGYDPVIEEEDFADCGTGYGAIAQELKRVLPPLVLDESGHCPDCAKLLQTK